MTILVKDDQGLGTALLMEDYSRAKIEKAKQNIHEKDKDLGLF